MVHNPKHNVIGFGHCRRQCGIHSSPAKKNVCANKMGIAHYSSNFFDGLFLPYLPTFLPSVFVMPAGSWQASLSPTKTKEDSGQRLAGMTRKADLATPPLGHSRHF
jgi:hypothetical protein